MKKTLSLLSCLGLAAVSTASAATILNTGAAFDFTAANWSNGAPTAGNDGTISANYTFNTNAGAGATPYSVTQTAGAGTGTQFNPNGNANFTFNLQGGSITSTAGTFFINTGITNVSGGSISTVDRFTLANGGRFSVSGGTLTSTVVGGALFNSNGAGANILNLSGGTSTGANVTSLFGTTNLAIIISGSSLVDAFNATSFGITTSTLNFLSTWTGALRVDDATDWSAQLINSGATLNGVDISAGNIGQFNITNGPTFDTISLVPEPSVALLGGLGMLALLRRRRA